MSSDSKVYKKGDVVLVSFPYTSDDGRQTLSKRRPAVIVSNDHNNARLDDVLVVPLTSNAAKRIATDCYVTVAMDSEPGIAGGIRLDSVIDCTVIATIPKRLLVSKIGHFPPETVEQIDQCIAHSISPDGRPPD